MFVIGIVGFIGSGKGTVGDILRDSYGFQQKSFAGPLKDAVSAIFGWPRHLLEGDTKESRDFREIKDQFWSKKLGYDITPRLILQRFGTESCREVLGEDIWVAALEKSLDPLLPNVVTDVRFPNELELIRNLGGFILWVQRGELPEWYQMAFAQNTIKNSIDAMGHNYPHVHRSEWAWVGESIDYHIQNDGTLEELRNSVAELVTESYIEHSFRLGALKGFDHAIVPTDAGGVKELLPN